MTLSELVAARRIVVCCGAGGVGKTTTAAALAVASARRGRRVLVLTIDPSKRLAETLGVARNPPAPVAMPPERQAAAGIVAPGSLEAWMLDPQRVSDESVRRLVGDAEASRFAENRIYKHVTSIVAGLHEYTAMKALHDFVQSGRYDLVVLDTPPARNALDFLEAPGRLARFLDGSIFRLFLPKDGGLLSRAASKLMNRALQAAFGEDFAAELTQFFAVFGSIFASLNGDLQRVRTLLSSKDSTFLLVTAPTPAALAEARFFHDRILELGLPLGGLILNRSRAGLLRRPFPSEAVVPDDLARIGRLALPKLQGLADQERALALRDDALLHELAARLEAGGVAAAVPTLARGADDLPTLLQVGEHLLPSG